MSYSPEPVPTLPSHVPFNLSHTLLGFASSKTKQVPAKPQLSILDLNQAPLDGFLYEFSLPKSCRFSISANQLFTIRVDFPVLLLCITTLNLLISLLGNGVGVRFGVAGTRCENGGRRKGV